MSGRRLRPAANGTEARLDVLIDEIRAQRAVLESLLAALESQPEPEPVDLAVAEQPAAKSGSRRRKTSD